MNKTTAWIGRLFDLGLPCVTIAFAALTLAVPRAEAHQPPDGPQCGPSLIWVCTGDGPRVRFIGTQCDRSRFERQTDFTCVPFGF